MVYLNNLTVNFNNVDLKKNLKEINLFRLAHSFIYQCIDEIMYARNNEFFFVSFKTIILDNLFSSRQKKMDVVDSLTPLHGYFSGSKLEKTNQFLPPTLPRSHGSVK